MLAGGGGGGGLKPEGGGVPGKFIAELRRAKRASGAPWVIKFGEPSI